MHCSHCERRIWDTWMMKALNNYDKEVVYYHLRCYEKKQLWNFCMGAQQVRSDSQESNSNSDEE